MEFKEIVQALFQYGGTVILALLFIWVFITDKTKNDKLEEDNNVMLKSLLDSNKNVAESNNNIAKSLDNMAKSLDIISSNLVTLDKKADRNYFEIKSFEKEKEK